MNWTRVILHFMSGFFYTVCISNYKWRRYGLWLCVLWWCVRGIIQHVHGWWDAQSSVSLMLWLRTKEIRVATGRLIMIIVLEWKRYEKFSYLHHVPLQISRNTMTLVFLIVKSAYFRTPDTCSQFAFDGVINSTSISSDFLLKYDPINN